MRGIKYISPRRDHSGYGEAARNYILALHRCGMPITLETISFEPDPPPVGTAAERELIDSFEGLEIDYDVVIVHLTPDLAPRYAAANPGKYIISMTVWETSKLHPQWVSACNSVDEVWVPCAWNAEAFKESGVERPIYKMPHGIDATAYDRDLKQFSVGNIDKADTFIFYSIFQWNYRKNPIGLLQSYFNAFGPEDNVALVLKTYMGRGLKAAQEKEQFRAKINVLKKDLNLPYCPKLYLVNETLSGEQMRGLHCFGDAYVSLTRGEGFGLPMLEAGLAGNPVIATGMGGNMEFMAKDNSYPVDFQWSYVSLMSGFNRWYLGNQQWAEPDLVDASRKMREVYLNKTAAAAKAKLLQDRIKTEFSWDSVVEPMVARLKEIQ